MSTAKIPLYIRVAPIVKEFIVSTRGTDVIDVCKNDRFFEQIKYILQLPPKNINYKNMPTGDNVITLFVPTFRAGGVLIYPQYRNYLDDQKQYLISNEIKKLFKSIFYNYMLAYCRSRINNNIEENQKEAVNDFCLAYNLSWDVINYEMLIKSWNRSNEKKMLSEFKNKRKIKHCKSVI